MKVDQIVASLTRSRDGATAELLALAGLTEENWLERALERLPTGVVDSVAARRALNDQDTIRLIFALADELMASVSYLQLVDRRAAP